MNTNNYCSCSLTAGAAIAIVLGLHGIAQAAMSPVAASAWPNKPIRIIVGTTPGSPPDIVARILGERLVAALGQPVAVYPRFSISALSGRMKWRKSSGQVERFCGIPQTLHPCALLHRDSEV